MKHVSILIPFGHTSLVNIEGTHQILNQVNGFCDGMGKPAVFDVKLVGLSHETRQTTGLFTVNPDVLVKDVKKTDLIIIPAVHGHQPSAITSNSEFIPWIKEQYRNGAEVVSFCIGSYFLAATGLLDGKKCATHWLHVSDFKKMYPEVNVVDDKILTEEVVFIRAEVPIPI